MTVAVSVSNRARINNKNVNEIVVTFSSSYTTGGEAFSANAVGLSRIDQVFATAPAGYVLAGSVGTNGTQASILVYGSATTTAQAALAELSAGAYPNALTNGVVKAVVYGV